MAIAGFLGTILARKGSAVWSISPDATVFEAIQLMADKNVGALPVVDNSRLIGIISERDYTRKVILKGLSSKDTPVRDIMTREVLTASPSDSYRGLYAGNDRKAGSPSAGPGGDEDDRDCLDP